LPTVSRNTALVLGAIAFSIFAGVGSSTKATPIPSLGNVCRKRVSVPP